jgi:hypothetical protein
MKSFKLFLQILMIAAVAASITACSKKSSKSEVRARSATRTFGPNGNGSAPGSQPTNPSSQWGEVINFNRNALAAFLRSENFGDVSAQSNGQTGIRFYGQINNQGVGQVNMFVFDSYALQGQGPIELPTFNCNGSAQGNQLTIQCSDGSGDMALVGYESQSGEFSGQVYYDGNNVLGQFRISACGFLGCY